MSSFLEFIRHGIVREYDTRFSKVAKHLLEAITMARNNENIVIVIVLNAFTETFCQRGGSCSISLQTEAKFDRTFRTCEIPMILTQKANDSI